LWAESAAGRGATFHLSLPAVISDLETEAVAPTR
jgi:hypothetical protein